MAGLVWVSIAAAFAKILLVDPVPLAADIHLFVVEEIVADLSAVERTAAVVAADGHNSVAGLPAGKTLIWLVEVVADVVPFPLDADISVD